MGKLKRQWLKLEQLVILNKHILWVAVYALFFIVFPFFVTGYVDCDAISSTIPCRSSVSGGGASQTLFPPRRQTELPPS